MRRWSGEEDSLQLSAISFQLACWQIEPFWARAGTMELKADG
jgi:hypothetical protein